MNIRKKHMLSMLILALLASSVSGCSQSTTESTPSSAENMTTENVSSEEDAANSDENSQNSESSEAEEQQSTDAEAAAEIATEEDNLTDDNQETWNSVATIDYDGSYDTYPEVALYIHTYDELPSNYMTKKEAQKLGWSGGSLENYAPGMCIGGSYFGNNEGFLPEEDEYTECDIETLGKSKRGAKRIVFSDDGDIYYTSDHYESFHLLYTAEGEVEDCVIYDADGVHYDECQEDHSSSLAGQ